MIGGLRREEYPILAQKTYLASHSLGAVPRGTAAALQSYHDEWATLGIEAWDGPWWEATLGFCASVEAIIGAPAGTVVPVQNVTLALGAVQSCFDITGARRRVVMTDLEFTTSYPFWRAQERAGAEVVIVPSEDGVSVPAERLAAAIDERTLLVAVSHVIFRSGAVQDLAAVVRAAHRHGALVLGDGYQAVGTVPVDVAALGIDFYTGGSHKWLCGGPGAAWLYVREDHARTLRPRLTGWFGLANPFDYTPGTRPPEPAAGVFRFMSGTPNVPAFYAAREGLRFVREVGLGRIREVQTALTAHIITQADVRGMRVKTPRDPEARSGMVCLDFPGAKAAVAALGARGIIVDHRPDCGLRASPHFYSTMDDLDRLFEALDEVTT